MRTKKTLSLQMQEMTYLHKHWESFLELVICKAWANLYLLLTTFIPFVDPSVDAQLQEICIELKRIPCYSNVGSFTFPHNKDIDNDSEDDVHQVASFIKLTEFFLVIFPCISATQYNLIYFLLIMMTGARKFGQVS